MSNEQKPNSFAEVGKQQKDNNILKEFLDFLKHNKRWWLLPIVITLLGLGILLLASGGAMAPFIYTLF